MRILILKPSSLGDVVHALPVLRLIKKAKPEAKVYWWISENLAPLLADDPDLEDLFLFQRKGWRGFSFWMRKTSQITQMRELRFDWVIDLQSLARSGLLAWLANGGLTIGLDDTREGATGFYDIRVPRPSYHTHAVDWYLSVLSRLGVPVDQDFTWLPVRTLGERAFRWRSSGGMRVVLNPGARWMNKRWPSSYFGRLAELLRQAYPQSELIVLGGKEDCSLGEEIAQALPGGVTNLAGKTSIPEMVEIIRESDLMVTNDTGPMHIAAALGKPLVALFGPTDPRRTGPYGEEDLVLRTDLPCVPCMKSTCRNKVPLECLGSISPQFVMKRIQQQFFSGQQ